MPHLTHLLDLSLMSLMSHLSHRLILSHLSLLSHMLILSPLSHSDTPLSHMSHLSHLTHMLDVTYLSHLRQFMSHMTQMASCKMFHKNQIWICHIWKIVHLFTINTLKITIKYVTSFTHICLITPLLFVNVLSHLLVVEDIEKRSIFCWPTGWQN